MEQRNARAAIMYIPRYLISLTRGIQDPLLATIVAHTLSKRGPMRKNAHLSTFNSKLLLVLASFLVWNVFTVTV